MKRIVSIVSVFLAVLLSAVPAFGWEAPEDSILGRCARIVSPEDYVLDWAEILTDEDEKELAERSRYLADNFSCGVYILTVADMYEFGYNDIESFSEDWFDTVKIGVGSSRNGILLVLSMADRSYDIDAYGNFANTAFTDYGKSVMADRFIEYFRYNDWRGGFDSYQNTCERFLASAWQGEPFDVGDSLMSVPERLAQSVMGAAPIGLIAAIAAVAVMKRRMNNARQAGSAAQYVIPGSIVLYQRSDRFSHVTRTRTVKSSPKSGGGGTSVGGGGHSHSSGRF